MDKNDSPGAAVQVPTGEVVTTQLDHLEGSSRSAESAQEQTGAYSSGDSGKEHQHDSCMYDHGHTHSHDSEEGNNHTHHSHHGRAAFTPEEEMEERQHFKLVVSAFRYYRTHAMKKIARQRGHYQALTKTQGDRLPHFMDHLEALRQCVIVNHQFLDKILVQTPFDSSFVSSENDPHKALPVGSFHMDKVHTTLRMFVRDWTREGSVERQQAYDPLIAAVEKYFPKETCDVAQIQILNPGAGLGRLSWELARRGYTSIGNEFSLYMLLASNFVLNCCQEVDGYKIYPWIGHASNNLSSANQMVGISVPDVSPSDLPSGHSFGMVAGDFLEVFDRNETWDAVVTCFFIDTARNILDYVEHMWHLLKPGGYWMNLGPLLYHFADIPHESCLELTYEHVKTVIRNTGFEFVEEKTDIPCSYVQNPFSMLRSEYRCVYFVCRKSNNEAAYVDANGSSLS